MFGISMWEMALIILVGLIFLGPRQLTETARAVGRLFREVQRMASDVKDSIDLDAPPPPRPTPAPMPAIPSDTLQPAKNTDKDILNLTGEKSGPDFYAELLENSLEDNRTTSEPATNSGSEAAFKADKTSSDDSTGVEKPQKS